MIDGKRISGGIFDFALFFFHNAKEQLARGAGPYFYLPKLESYQEARLWNDIFIMAQEELGIPRGSIKATVLIETVLAAFEMDEMLYELREHSAGLNAGRWDYIFSYRRGETQEEEQRRVTLFFNGLILANIQADALPSERELIMEIDEARKRRKRQDKPVKTPDGPVAKVVPAFPNPTGGVGIPAGGNRQDSE